jgi:RNA polymerase sigma factor (sigma-70 family)
MVSERSRSIVEHLRKLTEAAQARDTPDQGLVEAFVATRSEAAFAALVRRHGPMVLNLCRRVLGNHQDAEDAFQATFLVLARKASSLRDRPLVGSWLYGVACRTARKALTARARRAAREQSAAASAPRDPLAEVSIREAQGLVDAELERLPEKYRAPLVLCCLEGLARDEAARQLGWAVGLLKSRLEQARELLRSRLARRGLPLPTGLLAVDLFGTAADAGVPAALMTSTTKAAGAVAAGGSAAGLASAEALALSEGMVRMMFLTKVKLVAAVVLALVTLGVAAAAPLLVLRGQGEGPAANPAAGEKPAGAQAAPRGEKPGRATLLKAEALERWGKTEALVIATLTQVQAGLVAQSEPPIYNHSLQFTVNKTIRGSFKKGENITAHHAIKQKFAPVFPVGKECLVALQRGRSGLQALVVQEATPAEVTQATLACSVPLGWSLVKGRLLSPWAALGKGAWPADAWGKGRFVCAETGRPALMAGPEVEFTVRPVPPKKEVKWGNPDGDGEYRVTVKNVTDQPVTVPALLRAGDKILWDESLVILCQGKVYPVPGARGVKETTRPVVLKPGEEVSTVVNALKLEGPAWPRGGYRIEFQFALGEKSTTQSFYYLSRHHDPIRAQLLGKGAAPPK